MKKGEKIKTRNGLTMELRPNGTRKVYCENNEPDMAQQQYKDQCCINKIMEKHDKGYMITHLAKHPGRYAELGEPTDLLDAKMRVIRAEEAFMALPAALRLECDHDPVKFLEMLNDPTKDDVLVKYGVKTKKSESVTTDPKPSDSAVVNGKGATVS